MNIFIITLFAFFGGLAVNFLSLTEIRTIAKPDRPETFTDWIYSLWFFGVPILGAVLAYAYKCSGTDLSPILSINIGASAPLILKAMASAVPQIGTRKID